MQPDTALERRQALARASQGASREAIYRRAAALLQGAWRGGGILLDVGCGRGALYHSAGGIFENYWGADLVAYEDFPPQGRFIASDLNTGPLPLPDGCADAVASLETIEHLENPRGFLRELARLAKPGGLVLVSTPHQLSWLSLATLLRRGEYNDFQARPGLYPAHITALLPVDLLRMAAECGLQEARIAYSHSGRMPGGARHWPWPLRGPRFSDQVFLLARKQ